MSTSLAFPHLARPVEAGSHEQSQVQRLPRLGAEYADKLIGHLNDPTNNPEKRDIARNTVRYVRAITEMSNQGRREVLGLLVSARSGEISFHAGAEEIMKNGKTEIAVRTALDSLKAIYAARTREGDAYKLVAFQPKGQACPFDSQFLSSAMLLTRTVAPLGVNIVQPAWDPKAGPTSIPADKTTLLFLTTANHKKAQEFGCIAIKPAQNGDCLRVKLIPPGKTWSEAEGVQELRPGHSLMIGRTLKLCTLPAEEKNSLFGLNIPPLRIEPQINPAGLLSSSSDAEKYSRAAITLALLDGKLFVLDCGSKSGLMSPLEHGGCISYVPRTVIENERTRYGMTSVG